MSTGQGRDSRRIVVVVDWSEPSKAALRWAIRQAELTGAEVEAVTTWWYPPGSRLAPTSDGLVDLEGDAGKTLVGALAEVSGVAPDVVVCPRVVEGYPAEVVVRAACGADLFVVGTQGHGRLAAALLGSVSQHRVQHAPCPVPRAGAARNPCRLVGGPGLVRRTGLRRRWRTWPARSPCGPSGWE